MIAQILDLVGRGKRFLVAAHEGPDGDALASTLALTLWLRQLGKDVVAFNVDGVPESLAFLPGADSVVTTLEGEAAFDAGFLLDAGELRRAGADLRSVCATLVNIDHHPHSEHFGEIHFVDEKACATGALIYRLIMEGGGMVTGDIALCVYTAILSDTGSFRYSNANPEAFHIAAEMVDCGVDPWQVASGLYENQPEIRLRLLGLSVQTLTVSSCGRYASITATQEMLKSLGARAEHTDSFVNYPRSIRGVEVGIFFRELEDGRYKVGFRSKGLIDVGAISRELGGGGHHNAAGAVIDGPVEAAREKVFSRIEDLLKP